MQCVNIIGVVPPKAAMPIQKFTEIPHHCGDKNAAEAFQINRTLTRAFFQKIPYTNILYKLR